MDDERNLSGFTDGYWWSGDGLKLHYRDYAGRADRPPILCLPGLTRNARDFEGVAARLAGDWRVIAVEMRGRGESAQAKDAMTYVPSTYLQDIEALIAELGLTRFAVFGTSLGGILAMMLAAAGKGRIAGVLLNDVGPELETAGLARIRGYVGKGGWHPTWMHAARATAEAQADVYPDYEMQDWLRTAKRLYRLNPSGRIAFDYDMRIAEPFRLPGNEAVPDMWQAFDALADTPVLVTRGARSDILSAVTAQAMADRFEGVELVTVAERGHAPTLEEPEAMAGIDRLLARVEGDTAPGA